VAFSQVSPVQGKWYGSAGRFTEETGLVMVRNRSDPYEKLVEISVFGKKFQVPEKNSLLRCFLVHQPGNDSVWTLLLEPGLPVLPGDVPTAG